MNIGIAAHITAASQGFARWDGTLSPQQRASYDNGIWLCQNHAHQIDHDEKLFTVEKLKSWKRAAEDFAYYQLLRGAATRIHSDFAPDLQDEFRNIRKALGLRNDANLSFVREKAAAAAIAHVSTFESQPSWPPRAVSLGLYSSEKTFSDITPTDVHSLARAVIATQRVVIVAPAGAGKTTILLQLARCLGSIVTAPLFVPLSEWSHSSTDLFHWLANRYAFQGLRAEHLQLLAHHGEVALLLDGWNELPYEGRSRLVAELAGLQRDFPLLSIVMSTRRQARDVPLSAVREVGITSLSAAQQREMAHATAGDDGLKLLDRARLTRGLRELARIPLYLNAMLRGAVSGTLPETRGELIALLVQQHEVDSGRAEFLDAKLVGQRDKYLESLAVAAQSEGNTSISTMTAVTAVSQVNSSLSVTYHTSSPPATMTVLEALTNIHALRREIGDSYAFPHQQVQEWYASFELERAMAEQNGAPPPLSDPFWKRWVDGRTWEEPLLFACERLSRRTEANARAVANVILGCLAVDPMLAAAMIGRSSELTWAFAQSTVVTFASSWHCERLLDRGLTFMMMTGRSAFAHVIWPLVTSSDRTTRLTALAMGGASNHILFGLRLDDEFASLDGEVRADVLSEMIRWGSHECHERALSLAAHDPQDDVRLRVLDSLWFCGDSDEAEELLNISTDAVLLGFIERHDVKAFKSLTLNTQLGEIRAVIRRQSRNPASQLRLAISTDDPKERAELIAAGLGHATTDLRDGSISHLLGELSQLEPEIVARSLCQRILNGMQLPLHHERYLLVLPTVDSGELVELVANGDPQSKQVRAAISLVGPMTVKMLVSRFIEVTKGLRMESGAVQAEYASQSNLRALIMNARAESFVSAVTDLSYASDLSDINILSDLLSSYGGGVDSQPITNPETIEQVVELIDGWASALLTLDGVQPVHLSRLAAAIARFPYSSNVSKLTETLSLYLKRRREARVAWEANHRDHTAREVTAISYNGLFQQAFVAIGTADAVSALADYVSDSDFGEYAAVGLRLIWLRQNAVEVSSVGRRISFALVAANRQRRQANIGEIAEMAKPIFAEARRLAVTNDANALARARSLATAGAIIPHGDETALFTWLLTTPGPAGSKAALLMAMAGGGIVLDAGVISTGLTALLKEAETDRWLLDQDLYRVFEWLVLFPFSDAPMMVFDALASLASLGLAQSWRLRDLLAAVRHAPLALKAPLLRGMAERCPELVREYEWYLALLDLPVSTGLPVLLDVAGGNLGNPADLQYGGYHLAAALRSRMTPDEFEALANTFDGMAVGPVKEFLASILAVQLDDGLFLTLFRDESGRKALESRQHAVIEAICYTRRHLDDTDLAYELSPRNASTARCGLFQMVVKAETDIAVRAAHYLTLIDELRDKDGAILDETRHPDISLAVPWPLEAPRY